jgi:hypothetical protein
VKKLKVDAGSKTTKKEEALFYLKPFAVNNE